MKIMQQKEKNFAYIDGANLHRGSIDFGWKLDYAGLVKFLNERSKLKIILSPHTKDLCSILLKRTNAPIAYLNDQRSILQAQKEKAPDGDGTP